MIYTASDGEVATDDRRGQLAWAQADMDGGVTLLVPPSFRSDVGRLRLVTETMVFELGAFRESGAPVWDIAVCTKVELRTASLRSPRDETHKVAQRILVATGHQNARDLRARGGPDVLDWSTFASGSRNDVPRRSTIVRRALLLVQTVEALVKALEIYPIEVLRVERSGGQRIARIRAQPRNDRDRLAGQIGLLATAETLRRIFEEEHRCADTQWRISTSNSLGIANGRDIAARFVESEGFTYDFEIEDDLPSTNRYFLRLEQDIGTEQVIRRRLRNIAEVETRADLARVLDDPWRERRSSRELLESDQDLSELDGPKQDALRLLWATQPTFFVVGPPGVGKTMLATEVLRRRFGIDRATRMLLCAQGHDALDNLQDQLMRKFSERDLADILVVRSTSDRQVGNGYELQNVSKRFVDSLETSSLVRNAPAQIRARVGALAALAKSEDSRASINGVERSDLLAFSSLVLDGANVVISTANSQDVERLVEAHEQFDWVVIEEAAKATGPELVGPLMLSGRRLLIGDHHQLPPFDAE